MAFDLISTHSPDGSTPASSGIWEDTTLTKYVHAVYFLAPPVPALAEALAADMLAEAARLGIETIGNAASARVPVDWYYDTTYHLTEKGAEAQSERLAPLLEQALGRS